jgi:hypothetical protein
MPSVVGSGTLEADEEAILVAIVSVGPAQGQAIWRGNWPAFDGILCGEGRESKSEKN